MSGVELIALERQRQIDEEGWSVEFDCGENPNGELALAAVWYTLPEKDRKYRTAPLYWPWAAKWWKPSSENRVRELVKAGALIAAEIDRLQALEGMHG